MKVVGALMILNPILWALCWWVTFLRNDLSLWPHHRGCTVVVPSGNGHPSLEGPFRIVKVDLSLVQVSKSVVHLSMSFNWIECTFAEIETFRVFPPHSDIMFVNIGMCGYYVSTQSSDWIDPQNDVEETCPMYLSTRNKLAVSGSCNNCGLKAENFSYANQLHKSVLCAHPCLFRYWKIMDPEKIK